MVEAVLRGLRLEFVAPAVASGGYDENRGSGGNGWDVVNSSECI